MPRHQGSVEEAHLQGYLDELVLRFNRRRGRSRGLVFGQLPELTAGHDPVRYRDIVGKRRPSAPKPLCDTPNGGRPRSRPAASVQDRPILNAGPCRTTIAPKSARSTAAYQTDASASTRTSPTRMAMGATHAAG